MLGHIDQRNNEIGQMQNPRRGRRGTVIIDNITNTRLGRGLDPIVLTTKRIIVAWIADKTTTVGGH